MNQKLNQPFQLLRHHLQCLGYLVLIQDIKFRKIKTLEKLSDYYLRMKRKQFAKIVAAPEKDPVAGTTIEGQSAKRQEHGKLRAGRPRLR